MVQYQANNEQYPLLLLIIDDNDSNLVNQRNNSRVQKINLGARSILAQWPNQLNTCWLIGIMMAIILFLLTLMIITMIDSQIVLKLSKCNQFNTFNNQSIYLIYNNEESSKTKHDGFIGFVEKLEFNYPNYQINIIQIVHKHHHQSFDFERIFNNSTPTNVVIKQIKYREIFNNSPLYWRWFNLSDYTRNFLVRVLELWKFGGLSFDLNLMNYTNIDEYLLEIRKNYENLTDNQILFDKNGLYFGSKIPCHIVFGRILMLIKHNNIDNVIKTIMMEFCNLRVIKNCNLK